MYVITPKRQKNKYIARIMFEGMSLFVYWINEPKEADLYEEGIACELEDVFKFIEEARQFLEEVYLINLMKGRENGQHNARRTSASAHEAI